MFHYPESCLPSDVVQPLATLEGYEFATEREGRVDETELVCEVKNRPFEPIRHYVQLGSRQICTRGNVCEYVLQEVNRFGEILAAFAVTRTPPTQFILGKYLRDNARKELYLEQQRAA